MPHDLTGARVLDVAVSGAMLVLLAPVLVVAALLVRAGSRGPVIYRQVRVGREGQPFVLFKFRTMTTGADAHGRLTIGCDDPRVTRFGGFLRRHKIDELPQLANVIRGDMALVGPRPEVPEYVRWDDPAHSALMQYRPGLTDPASLAFSREEDVLCAVADVDRFYRDELLPRKVRMSLEYMRTRSLRSDIRILLATARTMAGAAPRATP